MTDPVGLLALARETQLELDDDTPCNASTFSFAKYSARTLAAEVVRLHEAMGKLPSPVKRVYAEYRGSALRCDWCGWEFAESVDREVTESHPANGCLALLVLPAAGPTGATKET